MTRIKKNILMPVMDYTPTLLAPPLAYLLFSLPTLLQITNRDGGYGIIPP